MVLDIFVYLLETGWSLYESGGGLNCFFVYVKLGIQRELLARNLDGDFWY